MSPRPLAEMLVLGSLACVLSACGAAPVLAAPSRTPALAAIQSAQDHGASAREASLIELALANQELQSADELIAAGSMTEAALMLRKAEYDANRATELVVAAGSSAGP